MLSTRDLQIIKADRYMATALARLGRGTPPTPWIRRAASLGSSNYGPFLGGVEQRVFSRPSGDFSARLVTLEKCSPELSRFRLPLRPARVMDL
jgi:hypothetical protein